MKYIISYSRSGIVKNLLNSGHTVIVWNRTTDKVRDFVEAGATEALTPSDVIADADITFSCVSDPQVNTILWHKTILISD